MECRRVSFVALVGLLVALAGPAWAEGPVQPVAEALWEAQKDFDAVRGELGLSGSAPLPGTEQLERVAAKNDAKRAVGAAKSVKKSEAKTETRGKDVNKS